MVLFLKRTATLYFLLTTISINIHAKDTVAPKIKAIAFDAFPIFDPREIAKASEKAFPGKGKQLMELWRTRIFEYQWLRALSGKYEDFMSATSAGLVYATNHLGIHLTEDKKKTLLNEFLNLKMWPDAPESIEKLKKAGIELVFLSNMTEEMIRNGLKNAGLENEFKAIFSTDAVKSYKPAPSAYELAMKNLNLSKNEILFVAFAGWDVAGSKWFGYPTYWVNRLGLPKEELDVQADAFGKDLSGLVNYVIEYNRSK